MCQVPSDRFMQLIHRCRFPACPPMPLKSAGPTAGARMAPPELVGSHRRRSPPGIPMPSCDGSPGFRPRRLRLTDESVVQPFRLLVASLCPWMDFELLDGDG